jgi:hypothetical protein
LGERMVRFTRSVTSAYCIAGVKIGGLRYRSPGKDAQLQIYV